jgi:hypothetical protein
VLEVNTRPHSTRQLGSLGQSHRQSAGLTQVAGLSAVNFDESTNDSDDDSLDEQMDEEDDDEDGLGELFG